MLQMSNTSPFEAEMFGFPNADGVDTLYVVVKGTFTIGARGVGVADEQQPVTLSDEYRGEPEASSLRRASEAHLGKPGTDVIVEAQACALGDRPVEHVDVSVAIAGRRKDARVQGDRYWTEGFGGFQPSHPEPFVRLPVVYERAFGGRHVIEPDAETYRAEARNPAGCGFLGRRLAGELLGQPVPNIEDMREPITRPRSRGTPVGFGPVAPSWAPRVQYAGTYDDAWERSRAPFLPSDFDPRFFNVAPAELVFRPGLVGGEPVGLVGFHPGGVQHFALPSCELSIAVVLAGQRQRLPYELETVVLEPTDECFTLSWRASLPVDKQLLRVEQVVVSLERIDGIEGERRIA